MQSAPLHKYTDWMKVAFYGGVLFWLYQSALPYLWGRWQSDDFGYGPVIPLVVLYLVWDKRARLAEMVSRPSWWGLAPLGLGLFLFWLGELGGEFTALFVSLWLVTVGLCWLHLGWKKLRVIAFPLVFGLAMFPPPNVLYKPILLKLKLISSQLGVKILQTYGMSAYREGNVIDLGFTQLQVVDACSGLRYVIPLLILGVLLAYFFKAPLWKRILLVLSTLPMSILTNSLRIASVGVLYPWLGAKAAEGFFHDFSGWIIFTVCLPFLFLEMWLLGKIGKSTSGATTAEDKAESVRTGYPESQGPGSESSFFAAAPSVVAVLLLAGTLVVAQSVDFREQVPLTQSFNSFPLQLGEWEGVSSPLEQKYLDALKLSDYALIDYRNGQGQEVNFYVAYNASQRKGESSHSPASCLPGSGWVFDDSGTVAVSQQAPNESWQVSRALMQKSGAKKLTYYWFPQRGRILTNMYQLKLYTFWDALTRQRTDGALVRLITPVYEAENQEAAEARLQDFLQQLVPVLEQYLPG